MTVTFNVEKLAAFLKKLTQTKPTHRTLDATLRDLAPELARIIRDGWDDETLIQALSTEVGGAEREFADFRRLLRAARRRERIAAETRRKKASAAKPPVGAADKKPSAKPQSERPANPGDIPFNDGI